MASNRFSCRLLENQRTVILDNGTRMRRLRNYLNSLEEDNHRSDIFVEETDLDSNSTESKQKRSATYYKEKYNRSFSQLVATDQMEAERDKRPSYMDAAVEDSKFPRRHFCNVCGYEAPYACIQCGVRFCSVGCKMIHNDTRCIRWSGKH